VQDVGEGIWGLSSGSDGAQVLHGQIMPKDVLGLRLGGVSMTPARRKDFFIKT
jgi:hypothetical protein